MTGGRDDAVVSYYGKLVPAAPVWEPRDIAGYLFLGGGHRAVPGAAGHGEKGRLVEA